MRLIYIGRTTLGQWRLIGETGVSLTALFTALTLPLYRLHPFTFTVAVLALRALDFKTATP